MNIRAALNCGLLTFKVYVSDFTIEPILGLDKHKYPWAAHVRRPELLDFDFILPSCGEIHFSYEFRLPIDKMTK